MIWYYAVSKGMHDCFVCVFSRRQVRAKVWRCRLTSSLFNTKRYAADLEHLYKKMWTVYESGQAPHALTDVSKSDVPIVS